MAINSNHLFDDLNGIKCAIVEKNILQRRVDFLQELLEVNGFTVIVIGAETPKVLATAIAKPVTDAETTGTVQQGEPVQQKEIIPLFTVGVTDVTFNATNAIFGRLLKTKYGSVVTRDYWEGKTKFSDAEKPYFE